MIVIVSVAIIVIHITVIPIANVIVYVVCIANCIVYIVICIAVSIAVNIIVNIVIIIIIVALSLGIWLHKIIVLSAESWICWDCARFLNVHFCLIV
jgi:hypothetical protein